MVKNLILSQNVKLNFSDVMINLKIFGEKNNKKIGKSWYLDSSMSTIVMRSNLYGFFTFGERLQLRRLKLYVFLSRLVSK